MVRVGCHVSIAGSIDRAVDRAEAIGCDTFQIFSRNPRGWKFKDLEADAVAAFGEKLEASGMEPVVVHMPYLPNLASPKPEVWEKSLSTLIAELHRCETLGAPFLVTHLGSHLGTGYDKGLERLINAIATALTQCSGETMLLLENTAGTKHSMGGHFEDIGAILDGVEESARLGVCLDTCHAFAAGYDLGSETGVRETMEEFERMVGIDRLKVVHLNDSKGARGSGLDRHEHIGLGMIGEDGFRSILNHPAIRTLPLICETPVDDRRDDAGNLRMVRELSE
jgi:deoxyribonuclease-4